MSAPQLPEPALPSTGAGEPVLSAGWIAGGATVLLALALSFGLPLTPDQKLALVTAFAFFAPGVAALFARRKVTPNDAVLAYRDDAGAVVAGEGSSTPSGDRVSVAPARHARPETDVDGP